MYNTTQPDDLGPTGHRAACSNRDFHFFYAGLEQHKLLIQKCRGCGDLRSLPSPACGRCHSLEWEPLELSGKGVVYSFTVHHHPPLPGFETPHPIAVAEMAEGVRLLGAMDGTPPEQVSIGLPITVEFARRGEVAAYRFRPA